MPETKSAEEMFKEIGFIQKQAKEEIAYVMKACPTIYIRFYLYVKSYEYNSIVDGKLHSAIHKQMQELGWVE